jgi:hypothetical protein
MLSLLWHCLNSGRGWLTRRDSHVSCDMPGWDSLQTVSAVHGAFQLAGLILLARSGRLRGFRGVSAPQPAMAGMV